MEIENYSATEDIEKMRRYSSYAIDTLLYLFIDYLSFKKVKFIIAPYEADSQLYYMYRNNDIDYVMSEDSDLVVLGCTEILRQFKMCKTITHFSFTHLNENSSEVEETFVKMGFFTRQKNKSFSVHYYRL